MLGDATKSTKFLGFLILAFAVSLGAPFWFDLLGKLVKVRSAGKKDDSTTPATAQTVPVQASTQNNVTVNTNSSSEGAIG